MKVNVKKEIYGHLCVTFCIFFWAMGMTGSSRGTGVFDRFDSKGIQKMPERKSRATCKWIFGFLYIGFRVITSPLVVKKVGVELQTEQSLGELPQDFVLTLSWDFQGMPLKLM